MITELGLMIVEMLTNYFKDIIDIPFQLNWKQSWMKLLSIKPIKPKYWKILWAVC